MDKHFLAMSDLTQNELYDILDFATKLKCEQKKGIKHELLAGKTLGMIFEKSSTRTRISFETGMFQLGGQALFLSSRDLQIGRGEPIKDTARVMSRYLDGIMIRTYGHEIVEELAKYSSIPVINALTDYAHPCQVLADLLTIKEYKCNLEGLKLCFIGDGNNMANSLIVGGLTAGMCVSIACPKAYQPSKKVLDFAAAYKDKFCITDSVKEAVKGADAVYTDVWTSMGQEQESQIRLKDFALYQVNEETMSYASPDALVLHCLPAHRGEEITDEVFEAHANQIFDEAENRLHVQKAVMAKLMSN